MAGRGIACIFRPAALALLACLAASPAHAGAGTQTAPARQEPRVNADAKVMVEFTDRVNAYVELHRKLEATLPGLSVDATAEQIDTHQRSLERLIQRARSNAKAGDVFRKETRSLFRRMLIGVFNGPGGGQLKEAIMEDNPGPIPIAVNGRYPDAIPLPTMPTQVLTVLPKLPPELEYRFIGDRLVLLDIHAHTVVDIIDNAVPK